MDFDVGRGLFSASTYCGADSTTFEGFSDSARDLGACAAMGLAFGLTDICGAGDRAGGSPFVLDADLAFDRGLSEGSPDYGCDEGGSDRDADCGTCHDDSIDS